MTSPSPSAGAPEVSFVMSLYNCLPLTQACVASLVATLPPSLRWELILVDDFSTDATREWLASLKDPRITTHLMASNSGYAKANNTAARLARAPYLFLINNDLVFRRGWFTPMWDLLTTRKGAGVVGNVQYRCASGQLDHTGITVNLHVKPEHETDLSLLSPRYRRVPAVTGACLAVKTTLWQALGGFDEQFQNGGEDVDFCFRVQQSGLQIYVALKSRIGHHVSPSPGRKAHDEQNSHRLASKWHGHLVRLAARRWSERFLERDLTAAFAFAHTFEALHLVAFAWHLTDFPPVTAVRAMHQEMKRQLDHWQQIGA